MQGYFELLVDSLYAGKISTSEEKKLSTEILLLQYQEFVHWCLFKHRPRNNEVACCVQPFPH